MSGEEDDKELELKDLIVQTLESNGLLAKIKVIQIFANKEILCFFKIHNSLHKSRHKSELQYSRLSTIMTRKMR